MRRSSPLFESPAYGWWREPWSGTDPPGTVGAGQEGEAEFKISTVAPSLPPVQGKFYSGQVNSGRSQPAGAPSVLSLWGQQLCGQQPLLPQASPGDYDARKVGFCDLTATFSSWFPHPQTRSCEVPTAGMQSPSGRPGLGPSFGTAMMLPVSFLPSGLERP